jgi:hypothetical protein
MQPSFCLSMQLYLVPLKHDYPLLVRNVSWLGLLNVVHLRGCVWEDEG